MSQLQKEDRVFHLEGSPSGGVSAPSDCRNSQAMIVQANPPIPNNPNEANPVSTAMWTRITVP